MDEAHSVGAIGPHGRGATDYFNVDPSEIDVLMGTFSKSFAAAGGYVAGSKAMVDRLRFRGAAETYAESIGPAVLAQIICAMSTMLNIPTPRGVLPYDASVKHTELTFSSPVVNPKFVQDHIHRVVFNSRYLRYGLLKLGFAVDGHAASPVVPLLIFGPGPWLPFRRLMRDRKIPVACVVVGYPATKLNRVRVRFCVSAKQTKEDIDEVLRACDEVGDVLGIRHGIVRGKDRWPIQRVTSSAIELVDTSFEESG
jgi:serine palmitoyltransferase